MNLTRRFVFRGNASALAGQIFRPKTIIVDLDGASSLGVSGGRSQAQIKGRSFGDVIRFGSAMTFAEGLFDDAKTASAVTDHKGRQEDLSSTTTVTSEIRELSVGQNPIFMAKRIRGTLVSRSPEHSGEPSIAPAKDTTIQGIDIGGRVLEVRLNTSLFQKYDTRSKLLAAVDDSKFVRANATHLALNATIEGPAAQGRARLAQRRHLHDDRREDRVEGQTVSGLDDRWAYGHRARVRDHLLRRAADCLLRAPAHDGALRARVARRRLGRQRRCRQQWVGLPVTE
jgi:hypothetical protein